MGFRCYWPLFCLVFISISRFIYTQNAPEDYVNAHNAIRKEVGVGPLTWNTTIAQFAESVANRRKADCPVVPPESEEYGENIAIGYEVSGLEAVSLWFEEKAYYNYSSNSCLPSKICEYYTQVVWKASIHIGCARVKCLQFIVDDAYYVVCNYHPPGNQIGEKPY